MLAASKTSASAKPAFCPRPCDQRFLAAAAAALLIDFILEGRSDNALGGDVRLFKLRRYSTLTHHEHPMREPGKLLRVARIEQDRMALGGEMDDQLVKFVLRRHVHTAGDVIEQKDARFGEQPPANKHLLLVAAAQRADRMPETRRSNLEAGDDRLRQAPLKAEPQHSAMRNTLHD